MLFLFYFSFLTVIFSFDIYILYFVSFPRYYLKEDLVLKQIIARGPHIVIILRPKSYEGFTVMSNIFNSLYSEK